MATILIIDTPAGETSLLASALRVEGFDVAQVSSVKAARSFLADKTVALALLDLMLRTDGDAHGLELARELKTAHPSMRVLLMSAYHLSERQLERADCGVSGFVPKPFEVGEVVSFIRTKLSGPPSSVRMCAAPSAFTTRALHAEPRRMLASPVSDGAVARLRR